MHSFQDCRRRIVGWDLNPPEPFPGFGGTVGLGQDCARLNNGDWLLVFHAGYWHMSMATPYTVGGNAVERWKKNGLRVDIDAPQGGRIMGIRSVNGGRTWSPPWTILNGMLDEGPSGLTKLRDGTLLIFVNNQASWYGYDTAPPGHLPVNTRIGVMRSEDHGHTWSDPTWLDMPYRFYQRAYAQALELPDGVVLYPTYCKDRNDGALRGVVHRSDDRGRNWRVISTIERDDDQDLDEPSLTLLRDGRIMMLTRLDAAVFYSDDHCAHWRYSHKAPLAPLKAHRTATLADGTIVCWMTSHENLCASWSTDDGRTWRLGDDGKPFPLDPEHYGYPGGFLMEDESIFAVYYDAANKQQRTSVWAIRFRLDAARERLDILPVPGAEAARPIDETAAGRSTATDVDAM